MPVGKNSLNRVSAAVNAAPTEEVVEKVAAPEKKPATKKPATKKAETKAPAKKPTEKKEAPKKAEPKKPAAEKKTAPAKKEAPKAYANIGDELPTYLL